MFKKFKTLFLTGLILLCCTGLWAADSYKPILTVSESGYEKTWNDVGRIADAMGYGLFIKTFDEIKTNIAKEGGLQTKKPIGVVVLSDGKEIVPFFFAPIAKFQDFEYLHNLMGEKLENKKGKFYFHYNDDTTVELIQKGEWLYGIAPKQADKLPQGDDPSVYLNGMEKNYLLSATVYCENIPDDLLDLALAPIRQNLALGNIGSQHKQTELTVEYLQKTLRNIRLFTYGIKVDSKNSLVSEIDIDLNPNNSFAEVLKNYKNAKTKWNFIYKPENAVLGLTSISCSTPESREFTAKNYQYQFDNYRSEISKTIENETDRKAVKKILDDLQKIVTDTVNLPAMGSAFMLTPEPALLIGCDLADGDLLINVFQQLADYFKKENKNFIDSNVKIASEEISGYKISSLTLTAQEAGITEEWAKNKGLCLIVGVKKNAMIALLNLDKNSAAAKFKDLAANKLNEAPLPEKIGSLSLGNLGKLLDIAGPDDKMDKQFVVTRKFLKQAVPNAAFVFSQNCGEKKIVSSLTISAECFKLIGDIIRNISAGQNTAPKAPKIDKKELEQADKLFD